MAGSAPHRSLTAGLPRLYELRNKERITVTAASKLLHNTVYGYKGYGLSMVRTRERRRPPVWK